ncbi:hypothetical protein R1sor_000920 [Riccia sorocarpa]|uniref:CCHC-type domain-containing protein n=1 Tax=Riccia sorocarpa TaxID=122646 RepID=A0ABD3GVD1_9MARC
MKKCTPRSSSCENATTKIPGKKIMRAEINHQELLNRNEYLRARSFVLYIVNISPSKDMVFDWAEVILHQEMGIKIERVRVLSRQCYLTPFFLGQHMVFALAWKATFNPSNLATCKVPVWVDLPNIHPSLERGCLRLDLSEELPEHIEILDPKTGEAYLHPIVYRSMPDACFHCHQWGHVVRACPNRMPKMMAQEPKDTARTGTARDPKVADDEKKDLAGLTPVSGRKGKSIHVVNPIMTTNPYWVLDEEDDAEDLNQGERSKAHEKLGTEQKKNTTPMRLTMLEQINMEIEKESKRKRDGGKEAGTFNAKTSDDTSKGDELLTTSPIRSGIGRGQSTPQAGSESKNNMKLVEAREFVVDYTTEGKAGVALLIRRNWEVVEKGVRGDHDGTLAWARVKINNRIVGFIAVHGPRERLDRARLWQWIEDQWETREWYLGGDLNSVETSEDSLGVSPIQRAAERRSWVSLMSHHDLADCWIEADKRSGPWFTRQKEVGAEWNKRAWIEFITQGIRMMRSLKNEKAPGADGMTTEMVTGEIVRYLGHPIGWNIKETQKYDYIIGRIQQRLGSWTYRMLTFAGRMVVMKHVLKGMPNHLLKCLSFNQQATDRLEAVCRKFLWGLNANGKHRIPLIVWSEVVKDKRD